MTETKPAGYVEARVSVPAAHVDAVCNFIVENITSGMVLEEEEGSQEVVILFYVPEGKAGSFEPPLNRYLSCLVGEFMPDVPTVTQRFVKDTDWVEKYRASVKAAKIGTDIYVRPSWSSPDPACRYDIVLEPKMAFGTGTHETTQSTLLAIRDHFRPGMRMLDLGCGSGILSILADKMGASYIKAIDYDLAAVENCRENFSLNKVEASNDVLFGSMDKVAGDNPYDFVCANIIKSTILPIIDELASFTTDGGVMVLSGLLEPDEPDIAGALTDSGLSEFQIRRQNKWLTFIVHKV